MKLLFISLTFCLSFCNSQIQDEPKTEDDKKRQELPSAGSSLSDLISEYGAPKVMTSLYFIEPASLGEVKKQIDSLSSQFCRIEFFFNDQKIDIGSLVKNAEFYFTRTTQEIKDEKLKMIKQWLRNDILLSSVLDHNLREDIFFEEIVSNIPEIKPLLNAYLTNPDQYFGSLDMNQSCKLYYDVNAYILKLDSESRVAFFKKYFIAVCEIPASNEK